MDHLLRASHGVPGSLPTKEPWCSQPPPPLSLAITQSGSGKWG